MATTASSAIRPSARPKATAPVKKASLAIAANETPATLASHTSKQLPIVKPVKVKPANKALSIVDRVFDNDSKTVATALTCAVTDRSEIVVVADISAALGAADTVKQESACVAVLRKRKEPIHGESVHAVEDVRYSIARAVMRNLVPAHEAALAAKAEVGEVRVLSDLATGSAAVQLALTQKLRA